MILCCHAAERQQAIESCHQLRIDLDDRNIFFERLEQVEIEFLLEASDAFLGIQNLLFVFLQLLRDVTLGSYQGLLAYPSFGHLVAMRIAHFDVVAENAVECHLERWDLVFLSQSLLELDEVVLAAIGDGTQFVELIAHMLAYHLSLAELDGRFGLDVMADTCSDAVARVDLFTDVLELRQIRFLARLLDLFERTQGYAELDDFARVGTPHGHLANDAFHVAQTAQSFIDRFGKVGVAEEVFHYVQALLDAFGMDEREEHPAVQQTASHRRGGIVYDAEERASALVHCADQLQATHGELVEAHIGLVVDATDGGDMARLSVLCGLQVAQDGSCRRGGKNHLLDTETLQVLRVEEI